MLTITATALLPNSVLGDATLAGEFKIRINYSLGIVTFLVGLTAMWVGTVNVAKDIEGYQIHMILTKPVSGFALWLGKFLGVGALCILILYLSACYIYFSISSEVEGIRKELVRKSGNLLVESSEKLTAVQKKQLPELSTLNYLFHRISNEREKEELKSLSGIESAELETVKARLNPLIKKLQEFVELENEVLTGRKYFRWTKPNYDEEALKKLTAHFGDRKIDSANEGDLQVKVKELSRALESSSGSLPISTKSKVNPKFFTFENLPEMNDDDTFHVRFRVYGGEVL
ncbi:MAG: hypothetical protein HRT88_03925, partial [Lentisphaeraceae bacterium]|nr:hypothetical protein [Lentisphaeraceae bacterium]